MCDKKEFGISLCTSITFFLITFGVGAGFFFPTLNEEYNYSTFVGKITEKRNYGPECDSSVCYIINSVNLLCNYTCEIKMENEEYAVGSFLKIYFPGKCWDTTCWLNNDYLERKIDDKDFRETMGIFFLSASGAFLLLSIYFSLRLCCEKIRLKQEQIQNSEIRRLEDIETGHY